jgi:hypothetical protein
MEQATNLFGEVAEPKPEADDKAAKDPKRVVHRWTEGGAEWGQRADGHLIVISCGDIAPGARVRAQINGAGYRDGLVWRLLPGSGAYPRSVIVAVVMDPLHGRPEQPDLEKPLPKGTIPARFAADELTVLRPAPAAVKGAKKS